VTLFAHQTVLLHETIEAVTAGNHGVYVDCTLGGGGHSEHLLQSDASCRVIAIDRDPAALTAATLRLAEHKARVTFVHGEFGQLAEILAAHNQATVQGIFADLGVSSPQLDHAERGFSFSKDGPLDMRMDPTKGPTALDLMTLLSSEDLANVIYEFGEERHSRRIAKMIKAAVEENKLRTTTELVAVIARCIPSHEQRTSKIHPATRTFQALRIAVNTELAQLESLLAVFPDLLAPGGRCAIISFHSLEDRLVKQRFRDLSWTSSLPDRYAVETGERTAAVCQVISKRPITASAEEIAGNPRSRSAKLRVCERTSAPNVPTHLDPQARARALSELDASH
jgi:16S rRNA (cytosine1402-N4)-methyltransferase